MNRTVIAHTPLPSDLLFFKALDGNEGLSELFSFSVDLYSTSPDIEASSLVGKGITLEIATKQAPRFLNGIASEMHSLGEASGEEDHYHYRVNLRPKFWYATQNKDSRVFVDKSVLEIAETMLAGLDYRIDCKAAYRTWGQCSQFQESGHTFLARLFEQEGIYYYFEHKNGSHTLILTDDVSTHQPILSPTVRYSSAAITDEPSIDTWLKTYSVTTSKFTVQEYSYKNAKVPMVSSDSIEQKGDIPTEQYEFYGGFRDTAEAKVYSKIRSEEAKCQAEIVNASGSVLTIAPGYTATLEKLPASADNKDYLICKAAYAFCEAGYSTGDDNSYFTIAFTAIPKDIQFRAPRITKKPQVVGIQSAVVTGPAGEEVYTNDNGDIKLQFHWDRYGQSDENSSNWVRVSQASAGGGFGSINTPRIGEEVILDFINGDIDRPLVITRAYNSAIQPPWGFPAAAMQSGIKSKSFNSPQANFNEMMFNDTAGSELVNFQAQKDLTSLVKNNETRNVNVDRTTTIGNNETVTVIADRKETVQKNETIDIVQNRTETVGQNETITVNQNRNRTVVQNEGVGIGENQSLSVGKSQSVTVAIDQKTAVGANQDLSVSGSRNKSVGKNEVTTIGVGRMQSVGVGSVDNVGGAQMTNIGAAYSLNVGGAWATVVGAAEVHKVARNFNVGAGKNVELSGGDKVTITAKNKLSLQCGSSVIVLEKNGTITILGKKIKIGGSSAVKIEGGKVDIN